MLAFYLSLLEEEHHPLFTEFYTRYRGKLYAVALSILKNHHLAEEAVQETFLKVIRHFETFLKIFEKSRKEIGPWAVTIVKNTALDMRKKEERSVELDEDWDAPACSDTEVEAAFRRLVALIRAIPEAYRQVLELRFAAEWTIREIAQFTGLSEAAVSARISRGRALLIEKLREEECEYE